MSEILFAKMTKERKKEFQICTKILEINGTKMVTKEPLYEEGVAHIVRMQKFSKMFRENMLCPIECNIEEGRAIFPYVEGDTLNDVLLFEAKKKNMDSFCQMLYKYKNMIYQLGTDEKKFESSIEFEKVFGIINGLENVLAAKNINIDNILENIIVKNEKYVMIDYEWTFDCYIPYNFVIYRAIIDLYINYGDIMNNVISLDDLLFKLDINDNEKKVYNEMNKRFNDYVFGDETRFNCVKQQYKKNTLNIEKHINNNIVYAQLYYDKGYGFCEENSIIQNISLFYYDDLQSVKTAWYIPQDESILKLRFDPMNYSGFIHILNITITNKDGKEIDWKIENNDDLGDIQDAGVFCLTNDPQIIIGLEESDACKIVVEMRISPNGSEEVYNQVHQISKKIDQLYCSIDCMQQHINRMQQHIDRLKYNNGELQKYIASVIK